MLILVKPKLLSFEVFSKKKCQLRSTPQEEPVCYVDGKNYGPIDIGRRRDNRKKVILQSVITAAINLN